MKEHPEFDLPEVIVPQTTLDTARRIIRLLEPVTSLSVVSEFLKTKELHHSAGSWQDMEENRILPALRKKEVHLQELARLLAEAEEFGRSHVFLYTAKSKQEVQRLMDRSRIEKLCAKTNLTGALCDVLVEEQPTAPTITQIREEVSGANRAWVFKIVETRQRKNISVSASKEIAFQKIGRSSLCER